MLIIALIYDKINLSKLIGEKEMKQKLFNPKDYPKKCENCTHGSITDDKLSVLCLKKGVKEPNDCCKSYKYDPLKRVPQKIVFKSDFNPEDFML